MDTGIIFVEMFEAVSFKEWMKLAPAVMSRLKKEAVSLEYFHWFAHEEDNMIGVVHRFKDAGELKKHFEMISTWDEFKHICPQMKMKEMRVHGPLPVDVEEWLRPKYTVPIEKWEMFLGGFIRPERKLSDQERQAQDEAKGCVLVQLLETLAPIGQIDKILRPLLARWEQEGVSSLKTTHWFYRPEQNLIDVVSWFTDASQMKEHNKMTTSWPEFQDLLSLTREKELRVHGELPMELQAWEGRKCDVGMRFPRMIGSFMRDFKSFGNKSLQRESSEIKAEDFERQKDGEKDVLFADLFEVNGEFSKAADLLTRVMARMEREGVSGLKSMHFFSHENKQMAAVVRYTDASQIIENTERMGNIPDFRECSRLMSLKEVRVLGIISPKVDDWLHDTFHASSIMKFERFLGGFTRSDEREKNFEARPDKDVFLIEIIEPTTSFDQMGQLVPRLTDRLKREGVPGLKSFYFFSRDKQIATIVRFTDSSQMKRHSDMISSWPEKKFLSGVKEMRVLGDLPKEFEQFAMKQFPDMGPIMKFDRWIGGFSRPESMPDFQEKDKSQEKEKFTEKLPELEKKEKEPEAVQQKHKDIREALKPIVDSSRKSPLMPKSTISRSKPEGASKAMGSAATQPTTIYQ